MEDGLAEAIDEGRIGPKDDPKVRGERQLLWEMAFPRGRGGEEPALLPTQRARSRAHARPPRLHAHPPARPAANCLSPQVRSKTMSEEFGWDKDLTKKIWCFGPDTMGPNILVDVTKGVQVCEAHTQTRAGRPGRWLSSAAGPAPRASPQAPCCSSLCVSKPRSTHRPRTPRSFNLNP